MITNPGGFPAEVNKYLAKYGSENWKCQTAGPKKFDNIIVVPALQEFENIKILLTSLLKNENKYFASSLVMFVVNNIKSAPAEAKSENKITLDWLKKFTFASFAGVDELIEKVKTSGLNVGFIDAASPGRELPADDGGVGFARKIGMDESLRLFDYSSKSKKIIICLDADCTVEKNYLTEIIYSFNKNNYSAGYVNFEHILPEDEEHRKAIISYEIFLRYYVLGLRFAGSPFAIHTIGSTMICDYESYIRIGGMNKRKAAEDFYFMEKLAKIGEIKEIKSTKVFPSARGSWRVPFGTGQRINRFFARTHNEFELYDPRVFEMLKSWLEVFNSEGAMSGAEYIEAAGKIHSGLAQFLASNSFSESWDRVLRNSKTSAQILKQKFFWFDGFRTLKLIHFLRDNYFPPVNMFEALDEFFVNFGISLQREKEESVPDSEVQLQYLEELRRIA